MISIVICNIDPRKLEAVKAAYATAMAGEPAEWIAIHNPRSIAEGYTMGYEKSHGEIILFSHDDIEILSPDFPRRLTGHLENFDIIGVAGTALPVSAKWTAAGPPHLFGQIAHPAANGDYMVEIFGAPHRVNRVQTVDGVFIAVKRAVMERVRFDAVNFDGFHVWDQDFCMSAGQAGLKIGVASDINLLHHSGGSFDDLWRRYAARFVEKWKNHLHGDRIKPSDQCHWAWAIAHSKAEAARIMAPPYW